MQKSSGVSQINLSSTSEKATRVFAQQTFGQLCIPKKILLSFQMSHSQAKTRRVIKRGEKGLWGILR